MANQRILVTGASGKLGRLVIADLLKARKPADIIAVTREPSKLQDLAKQGVDVRKGSFDDPQAALADTFKGAASLLLISTDTLDKPGARIKQHRNAVAAAKQAGVQYVVYTSLTKCEPGIPISFAPDHYGTEQELAASGLQYTVLRNNWYGDMLVDIALQSAAGGQLYSATNGKGVSCISRADCAAAAAAALLRGPNGKEVLELTGPAAVTFDEIAKLASAKTGKTIQHVGIDHASFVKGLTAHGVPPPLAEVFASFHDAIAEDYLGSVSKDFERLTGRQAKPLSALFA